MGTMVSTRDREGGAISSLIGQPPVNEFIAKYVFPKKGRTLIVGSQIYKWRSDRRKAYPNAVGIDMLPGNGVDRVVDLEEALPDDLGVFDHIECWSVLEHSRRPWLMAANIERLLIMGGTLHVAVPFIWDVHAYPDDYWRYTTSGIRQLFPRIDWKRLMYAHTSLVPRGKTPVIIQDEHKHLARTEVLGFGVKTT